MKKIIFIVFALFTITFSVADESGDGYEHTNISYQDKITQQLKEYKKSITRFHSEGTQSKNIENIIFKIKTNQRISGTMIGKYIQNKEIVLINKLNLNQPYMYIETKQINLKINEILNFNSTKYSKGCFKMQNKNDYMKFCNFKNLKELKNYTSNYFTYYFYKINKNKK